MGVFAEFCCTIKHGCVGERLANVVMSSDGRGVRVTNFFLLFMPNPFLSPCIFRTCGDGSDMVWVLMLEEGVMPVGAV